MNEDEDIEIECPLCEADTNYKLIIKFIFAVERGEFDYFLDLEEE